MESVQNVTIIDVYKYIIYSIHCITERLSDRLYDFEGLVEYCCEVMNGYGERNSFRRTVIVMDQWKGQMSSVDLMHR